MKKNHNYTYKLSTENFGTIFISVIYDDNNKISEIIIHTKKSGSNADYILQSFASLINLLLKHNVSIKEIIDSIYNKNKIFKNYFPNVLKNIFSVDKNDTNL